MSNLVTKSRLNYFATKMWNNKIKPIKNDLVNHTHLYIQDANLKMGRGLYGSSDIGISGNHAGGSASIGSPSVWLKGNNYFDGSYDRFMMGGASATQLYLEIGSQDIHVRYSTNQSTTNEVIEWTPAYKICTTRGGFWMNGHMYLDTSSGEKQINTSYNFGLFFNSNTLGWYDWGLERKVFAYERELDRVVTYRFFRAAGGIQYSLDNSSFSKTIDFNKEPSLIISDISETDYDINNYDAIKTKDGLFITNQSKNIKNLESDSDGGINLQTRVDEFYATLLYEIKRLKDKVEVLEKNNLK